MGVKEREPRAMLKEYKQKYGDKEISEVINCLESKLNHKKWELEEIEGDIWKLQEDIETLVTLKNTMQPEDVPAKRKQRPKSEKSLSAFLVVRE